MIFIRVSFIDKNRNIFKASQKSRLRMAAHVVQSRWKIAEETNENLQHVCHKDLRNEMP